MLSRREARLKADEIRELKNKVKAAEKCTEDENFEKACRIFTEYYNREYPIALAEKKTSFTIEFESPFLNDLFTKDSVMSKLLDPKDLAITHFDLINKGVYYRDGISAGSIKRVVVKMSILEPL